MGLYIVYQHLIKDPPRFLHALLIRTSANHIEDILKIRRD